MKICVVSLTDETTSTGRRLLFLSEHLIKEGYNVVYLTFSWVAGKGSLKIKDSIIKGVKIKRIFVGNSALSVLLKGFFGLLRNMDADIYYLSKSLPIHTIPFLIAKKFRTGKVILDMDDWEGIGGGAEVMKNSLFKRMLTTYLEIMLPKKVDAVTANSHLILKRAKILGAKKVLYLPNVVNLEDFNIKNLNKDRLRLNLKLNRDDFIFIYMSSFTNPMDAKSLIFFLKTLSLIKNKKYKVMILGDGKLIPSIKRSIKNIKIKKDNILFLGKVDYTKLKEYLAVADVGLVLQSDEYPYTLISRSNNPRKLYEMMSVGMPVLAPNHGEFKYVINKKCLYNSSDPDDLLQKINYLMILDQKNLKLLGQENRELTLKKFNFEVQTKKLIALLKSI